MPSTSAKVGLEKNAAVKLKAMAIFFIVNSPIFGYAIQTLPL